MAGMSLLDPFGRKINSLRLSVTGRCNLRCGYCRPQRAEEGPGSGEILSDDALLLVASTSVRLGIEKIRVTGGEPLVRKGIVRLLSRFAGLPGLKKLVLTTNGHFLPEMAGELREAGVESLNISLDSIRPERFARITGGGDVRRVLEGIAKAEECGFPYIKINMVVMRGINDDEIDRFAALTVDRPLRVRFIEYMPIHGADSRRTLTIPGEEILEKLKGRYSLEPLEKEDLGGPARYYRIREGAGAIGVITPISCHFCSDCNRIRVTSEGVAKGCLFSWRDVDLKPYLRAGDREGLGRALLDVVRGKPAEHRIFREGSVRVPIAMSVVGG